MLELLPGPLKRVALGVVALALLIGAIGLYGARREAEGVRKAEDAAKAAAALEYGRQVARVLSIGEQLAATVAAVSALEPKVLEKYRYVKQKNPLPADCRVDAERLRSLSDAIDASNAIGRRGGIVRPSVETGK